MKMENENLVIENLGLAYSRANFFDKGVFDIEELKSVSVLGLVKAAATYKLDKNVKFSTYSVKVIDNEIKFYLRNNIKTLGNISMEVENKNGIPFKETFFDDEQNVEVKVEEKDICKRALEKIKNYSLKEQKIFYLYIYNGYTTTLIGKIIGVSQSYVSRILKKMFEKLRDDLKVNNEEKCLTKNKINSII